MNTIKVLIIEDEIPARKKLKRFLSELEIDIQITAEIDTVAEGITFLKNNTIDLIFSDIELLDGNAFEIYNQISPSCPVVFTTAYDQFWMNAFDANGIAYLLKPFSKERFIKAWEKFMMFRVVPNNHETIVNSISKVIEQTFTKKSFKKRFMAQQRQSIYFLETENISFFEAKEGIIFAYDIFGKKHLINQTTLKEIEEELDPMEFFRINRSELVNRSHIEKIERDSKNTLSIKVKGTSNYLVTSQNSTAPFRTWLEQ